MAILTTIPSSRVDFIDPRTGLISREWYNFFINVNTRTGGGEASIGGFVYVTANYTPTNEDKHLLCDGTLTVTLQDPANRDDELIVTNVGTGIISLGGTVNGDTAKKIALKYTSLRLRPIDTSYYIV